MKKWIIIMGVLVGLIIVLLIQSDDGKMPHTGSSALPSQAGRLENRRPWFPNPSSVRNTHSVIVQIVKRRSD